MRIGIICDGNRRFAKKYNLSLQESYQNGINQVFKTSEAFFNLGVIELTIFGFSEQNWNREKKELITLRDLFVKNARNLLKSKEKLKKCRINFIGDISEFGDKLLKYLIEIQNMTKKIGSPVLNICLNYDGRKEIIDAVKKAKNPSLESIQENLWIKNDTDLIVRTGGYQRLSGFLLWQSQYAELYFTKKYWSELTKKDVRNIVNWYNRQKRNFGK